MAGERWVHSLKGLISQTLLPPHTAMNGSHTHSSSLALLVFHTQNTLDYPTHTHTHVNTCSFMHTDAPSTHPDLPAIISSEFLVLTARHDRNTMVNKSTDRGRRMTGEGWRRGGGRETE